LTAAVPSTTAAAPGVEDRPRGRSVADAAADLDRHRRRRAHPRDHVGVPAHPGEGAVEIDDVDPLGAGRRQLADQLLGALAVDRDVILPAGPQPHRLAVEQIDRGQDAQAHRFPRRRVDRRLIAELITTRQHEARQQLEAGGAALLGVELTREHVAGADRGAERLAVIRRQRDHRRVVGHRVVRVHEVEVRRRRHRQEQRIVLVPGHPVPAHVRHLDRRIGGREPHHPPGQDRQPAHRAVLLALVEQDLEPQADPQVRLAGVDRVADRIFQAALDQAVHERRERSLARHHDLVRGAHHVGVAGHDHLGLDRGQGLGHRPQVAAAHVDHRDHVVNVPLVEGTAPASRGSIAVA
jgi:hypothetical protein